MSGEGRGTASGQVGNEVVEVEVVVVGEERSMVTGEERSGGTQSVS